MNNEETGKWVLLRHRNYEPMDVYGFFASEKEALDYGMKYGRMMCVDSHAPPPG